jgi:hypothetical protein
MFRLGKTKVQTAVKKSSSRQPWRGETHFFLSRPSRQGDWSEFRSRSNIAGMPEEVPAFLWAETTDNATDPAQKARYGALSCILK